MTNQTVNLAVKSLRFFGWICLIVLFVLVTRAVEKNFASEPEILKVPEDLTLYTIVTKTDKPGTLTITP